MGPQKLHSGETAGVGGDTKQRGGMVADLLKRVCQGKERIPIEQAGKPVMYLVPAEDVQALEQLEDRIDIASAEQALREMREKGPQPIPWEQAKAQLLAS
ncbi:MAG: type II toxin-antitoxin system prevent-host-death family antitoxin [Myxococcota bacterium]